MGEGLTLGEGEGGVSEGKGEDWGEGDGDKP